MNGQSFREWAVEGAILVAVVLGAWFFFIDGKQRTLQGLEATIAKAEAAPNVATITAMLQRFADQTDDARELVASVQKRNTFAESTSHLYEEIKKLAAECNTIVHRLNPSMTGDHSISESVSSTRIQLAIEADYADTAVFIGKLQDFNAFLRPVSLRITPVPARAGYCNAELDCEVLQFHLPAATENAAGGPSS